MPAFRYTALDERGRRTSGVVSAGTEPLALADLESRRLTPVAIAPASADLVPARRVPARRLAASYQQLADLLRAGVPVLRSLTLLGSRKSSPRLSAVFRDLADAVSQGDELGEAMARRPEVFPRIHTAMVQAGERGGFLEAVLARLAAFVQGQADLRSKVVGNLIYPAILVSVGAVILSVIFTVFVPKFRSMVSQTDSELPWISRVVFAAGDAASRHGLFALVVLAVGAILLWRAARLPRVERWLTGVRTRMPVVGPLVRSLAAARFCRLLGTMLSNGIPMLTAMAVARDAAGNVLMEDAVDRAIEAVRAGDPLAPPLGASGLFEADVVEMISVGESANNLDEVLATIADTIEQRVDRLLTVAVRLIEPALLLTIALVVGCVAAGLILPITMLRPGME